MAATRTSTSVPRVPRTGSASCARSAFPTWRTWAPATPPTRRTPSGTPPGTLSTTWSGPGRFPSRMFRRTIRPAAAAAPVNLLAATNRTETPPVATMGRPR
uniref:(northern house mosquito) hypothetical protein n=1 Tax=Culex pipiens TaxID=7175 RepID=A0A8D8AGH9_CULPI